MVSVSKIGQTFTFNALPIQQTTDNKENIKLIAKNQEKIGYAALGTAALAAGGSFFNMGRVARVATVLPAVAVAATVGANLLLSSSVINKAISDPKKQGINIQA